MSRTDPPGPRFGGVDVLILGAWIAFGVWLSATDMKIVESTLGLGDGTAQFEARTKRALAAQPPRAEAPVGRAERSRQALVDVGLTMFPCLTLGVAVATFRHRGARSRRALRHVGVLTSAVAGIVVAVLFGGEFAFRALRPNAGHHPLGFNLHDLSGGTSLAIASLWGVLVIGRRWKATPDWPDRLGRAVGVAWIVYVVLGVLLRYAGLVIYRPDGTPA